MPIPSLPDRGSPHATPIAVRTMLCSQSFALSGALMRLRTAAAELCPPGPDGWSGRAERGQSAFVGQIDATVETVAATLEQARKNTDVAIWSMGDVG